jgi:CheY-like chemotaxis protein
VEQLRLGRYGCAVVDANLEGLTKGTVVPVLRAAEPHLALIVTADHNSRELESAVRRQEILYYHVRPPEGIGEAELIEAATGAVGPAPGTWRKRPGGRPAILVIDDDKEYLEAVSLVLGQKDYQVVSATDCTQGLELARRHKPDLIILDIMMGGMPEGFRFCYDLRRDPKLKHTPVLAVTALEAVTGLKFAPELDDECFPVDEYLTKPVTAERLLARVSELLGVCAAP